MKQVKQIVVKVFLLATCLFFSGVINAYDFQTGGLCYNITSANTVEVTSGNTIYTGDITIPSSVTNGDRTYSVTSIGSNAFSYCSGLTSVIIGASVSNIGSWAFRNCSGMTSVTIGASVSNIGLWAFWYCESLTSIIIPNSVKRIEHGAFYGCSGLNSVTIGNSVKSIETGAFNGCSGLTTVISLIEYPFSISTDCWENVRTEIATLYVPVGTIEKYRATEGWNIFSNIFEIGTSNPNESFVLDFEENGIKYNVTSINELTVEVTSSKTKYNGNIIIPSKVSNGGRTFSVTSIGSNAFSYCSGLTSVTIPNSVTTISMRAFEGCQSLTSAVIPNSVTTIGTNSFRNCIRLTSINIPNSVTSIEDNTFYGCSGITSVNLGESVVTIGDWAFRDCKVLTSINIPNSVTNIGAYSFGGCRGLSSITIPKSVTSIETGAFYDCIGLTDVYSLLKKPFAIYQTVFQNVINDVTVFTNATLHVPSGTKAKYQSTDGWNQFKNIVEIGDSSPTTYSLSVTATGNGSASYNGMTIREKNSTFTVNEGTKATIIFTPDNGYRIKSVKVNGSVLSERVYQYTFLSISQNSTIEVEFEAISYTLSITAIGNGLVSYNGAKIRGETSSFTVNEGTNATITFSPDNGYRIKSVKVNNNTVNISNYQYTISDINRNNKIEVEFEAIPPTTYTLSITATGNGSASYSGTTVRGKTSSFTLNEGTSATIAFNPDNGYRIKYVMVGGADVTAVVTNNQYTLGSIIANTTVKVEFEAIPVTTYTLSVTAIGNGSASYSGTTVRARTTSFTVNEGTNATVTFSPDNGYKIKSVQVNGTAVSVSNNQYTVSNITKNTTVAVEFEALPPTTYTLSLTATGYGSASYNGTTVRSRTASFSVNEGTNATITFTPDNGYRIKSVMVNNLTVSVSNNQYTVSNISRNTTVSVEFEAIPPTTYTLSITATGYGSASYNGTTVRGRTTSFTVNEGTSATITFSPDNGYRIKTVKVNDAAVTVSNNQYTVSNISRNTTVSIEFEGAISEMAVDGVSYRVVSLDSKTIKVASGNYSEVLRVPSTVNYEGLTFMVAGIESGALASSTNLAAVVWEPATQFTESVSNPNLLLYVSRADYAPAGIQNVVVNGTAERIVLTEAWNGNDFYCPEEFTARSISMTHHYSMTSGLESCQGWETIVLPFDVQRISHEGKGAMVPFAAWQQTDEEKPFWLYALGSGGWEAAATIRAYEPYIISVPNNDRYRDIYRLNGNVTFAAENVRVKKTDVAAAVSGGGKTLVPNFRSQSASSEVFALNVVNDYNSETAGAAAGSQFVRQLRPVHPFEAYLIANNMTRGDVIPVFEEYGTTNVVDNEIMRNVENEEWYSVDGRKLEGKPTRKGVYIKNRKTVVVK